jgi:Uma2 family endonuclease
MLTTTTDRTNLSLDLSQIRFTHEQFVQLCQTNQELRLELTANGELIVMPPAFSESSKQNSDLSGQVWLWNRTAKLGETFDSSGGFVLPNGAERAPDVSWVEKSRLEGVSLNQFLPLAPDFVIELRSGSDRLSPLQKKMQEYQDNGVRLGWLINPQDRQVEIYRLGKDKQVVQSPTQLSGEDVLAGFTLDLTTVW